MSNEKGSEELQHWNEKAASARQREFDFSTVSGAAVDLLYDASSLAGFDPDTELGYPGEYPYTRGVHPNMYRGRLWTMRQFAGFGTAAETNQRFRYLLEQGQTGLSTAFDLPTIMGYDSDHTRSLGEVGRMGVAIDSLADMERLFDRIPLDKVTTSMTINAPATVLLSFYLAVAERQGIGFDKVGGTTQNDILKEYQAQKSWIFPPVPSMRLIVDMMQFCSEHVPRWNTISISGYHIREAGSTAVQELAFTLGNGFAYVEAGIARGLDVDAFAPRLSFFFNSHLDFFEEIAKFRAARRIWAKRMRNKYGAKDPRSWLCRFHTQTAGVSLTAQQPENNIVRTAYQALAAILGGTQSLHTNSMDEALDLPTEKSVKIALRTQQIAALETGAASVIDPLGGSYFVESLTNRMEAEAEEYFAEVDRRGGVLACIDEGFFQKEIGASAYKYQRAVEAGAKIVVGVNRYVDQDEKLDISLLGQDPDLETQQAARTRKVREDRDNGAVSEALRELRERARGTDNLMPYILEVARRFGTEGEIIQIFREEFSEYHDPAYV